MIVRYSTHCWLLQPMARGPDAWPAAVASQVAEAQGSGEGWLCGSPTQALLVRVGLGREQGSHRGTSLVPYLKDICIFHNQIYVRSY